MTPPKDPDDGLPVQEVGPWAEIKHSSLARYVDMTRATRRKFQRQGGPGAYYVDVFCGPGRAWIRDTARFVDGSPLVAWKTSRRGGAAFSDMHVADIDRASLAATTTRLEREGAPATPYDGSAVVAMEKICQNLPRHGFHLVFLDPFSLKTLDFRLIEMVAQAFTHVDLIVHVSALDLRRNLEALASGRQDGLDAFAPGWKDAIDLLQSRESVMEAILQHWRDKVASTGPLPSPTMRPIYNNQGALLYWLVLIARHELAHRFWAVASNPEGQRSLFP